MKSFSGKASLMATLVAALVGASSAQAAEIKIGVVLPLSGALSGYGQPSQKGLDIIQAITPTLKMAIPSSLSLSMIKAIKSKRPTPCSGWSPAIKWMP